MILEVLHTPDVGPPATKDGRLWVAHCDRCGSWTGWFSTRRALLDALTDPGSGWTHTNVDDRCPRHRREPACTS